MSLLSYRPKTHVALLALVFVGFYGALSVSWQNMTGSPCPHLFSVPICYIVLIAYGLMLASLLIPNQACQHHFFCAGWAIAFIIALLASVAELTVGGGICPVSDSGSLRGGSTSGGIPLCYVSLLFLVVIFGLFVSGPLQKMHQTSAS